ncbi:NADPH:quinone reductase, partial [Actinomortierella ambigua]
MRAVQIAAPGDTSILKVSSISKPTPKPNEVLIKGSGEIVGLGSSVTGHHVGDRVAFLGGNTYAEYAVTNGDRVVKIPEGVSYEKAAADLSSGMSSMGLIQLSYKVQMGDWVLIHAVAGGVGLVLTQLCKQAGAHVIGLTSSDAKADLAKRAGADYVFNYKTLSHDEIIAQINKVTNGQMVDVVYDSVGADTFDLSLRSVRSFGTV